MPTALPIADDVLTASILSLAIPLGVLILVAIWYVVAFRHGESER